MQKEKKTNNSPEEKSYVWMLRRKRMLLRFILILGAVVILWMSLSIFMGDTTEAIRPQIARAAIQLSKVLPEFEKDEAAMQKTLETFEVRRQKLESLGVYADEKSEEALSTDSWKVFLSTLSWMERMKTLRIGDKGYAEVISQTDGKIFSHPEKKYEGLALASLGGEDIQLSEITETTEEEDLSVNPGLFYPAAVVDFDSALNLIMLGCRIPYRDTYIVLGIPLKDILKDVGLRMLLGPAVCVLVLWLFYKYMTMVIFRHEESLRNFRRKLLSYGALAFLFMFLLTWYLQALLSMTNGLNNAHSYSQEGADISASYLEKRSKIDDWLDREYLMQCRLAAKVVSEVGRDKMTRQDMQELAQLLGVKYVYAYDQSGNVVVTNSPYDHLRVSHDEESSSYDFLPLLDGVDSVVQRPGKDDQGEYLQHIGVSTRSREDLCDGFVEIALSPATRDQMVKTLDVDAMLADLTVGIPEYAMTVDMETLAIQNTTGFGYEGEIITELGIPEENLRAGNSELLFVQDDRYYEGSSLWENSYIITLSPYANTRGSFLVSLAVAFLAYSMILLISWVALIGYQKKVLDRWEALPKPEEEEEPGEEEEKTKEEDEERGIFSSMTKLLNQNRRDMDERWKVATIPRSERTPEIRIKEIINWIMFIFCLYILGSLICLRFGGRAVGTQFYGIDYVVAGNWSKGLNIFAFTACFILLCGMDVFVTVANRVLYNIALISSTRVETICLLLKNSMKYVCAIIFIYYGLSQFGVQTQTLLASAGALTLLVGIAAKELVGDIIAGVFMIFEGALQVGDYIRVGNWGGTVQEIGLRTTKVTFFSDTKVYNNSSLRDFINSNGEVGRVIVNVGISYDDDLLKVEELLGRELPLMEERIPGLVGPPKYQGVEELGENAVLLRIALYTERSQKFTAARALKREIKLLFDREGIHIPYPQVVVHNLLWDTDSENKTLRT